MSPDRDRILEQALTHELRAADMVATDACLDAETLGAWADDGLTAAAMVAAEAHVSSCARCQALVGAMMKSAPSTAAPGTVSTQATPGLGTFSLWRWWLAPIAAGVTAVTLWMVIPEQPELATAPPRADAAKAAADPVKAESAAPPASLEATADQLSRKDSQPSANFRVSQEQDKATEQRKEAEAPNRQQRERAALADAPPAAALPGALAETVTVAPRENAASDAALQKRALSAAPIEIPTLDRSRRWRIVNNNRIERTDDGGATWRLMGGVNDQSISAGSAPSNAVAWFVGSSGLVLLTTDAGGTLRIVNLAEPLDIASVSATDAQTAIVSTVSGRRFRTEDGGRTWRPF